MTCASCQESITDRAMKAKDQVSSILISTFKFAKKQLTKNKTLVFEEKSLKKEEKSHEGKINKFDFSVLLVTIQLSSTITSITLSAVAVREASKMSPFTPSKNLLMNLIAISCTHCPSTQSKNFWTNSTCDTEFGEFVTAATFGHLIFMQTQGKMLQPKMPQKTHTCTQSPK